MTRSSSRDEAVRLAREVLEREPDTAHMDWCENERRLLATELLALLEENERLKTAPTVDVDGLIHGEHMIRLLRIERDSMAAVVSAAEAWATKHPLQAWEMSTHDRAFYEEVMAHRARAGRDGK